MIQSLLKYVHSLAIQIKHREIPKARPQAFTRFVPHFEELERRLVPAGISPRIQPRFERLVATEATSYTLPLQNQTGLNPQDFSVYVLGYSTGSKLMLQSDGTFGAFTGTSGTISSFDISTLSTISLDANTELDGARLYFFVVPNSDAAPTVAFANSGADVTQPNNPPGNEYPFNVIEITVPSGGGLPTIDVQTVDGFIFPLTVTLNDSLGQVGQPLYQAGEMPIVNRQDIFTAYATFMTDQGSGGDPYQDLTFAPSSIDGQDGGILNPGLYLAEVDDTNTLSNLTSSLNTVWDTDLTTLFQTDLQLSIQGVASASGTSPPIPADTYTGTIGTSMPYPGGTLDVRVLKFTGTTSFMRNNGDDKPLTFYVYDPTDLTVSVGTDGKEINGQMEANSNILKISSGNVPGTILPGMFVSGPGLGPNVTVTAVNGNDITITFTAGPVPPAAGQYLFSKAPSIFETSGRMVFANDGVFADSLLQAQTVFAQADAPKSPVTITDYATVLGNIENQIVSALNRGVAVTGPTSGDAGYTSKHWGTQTNWYPEDQNGIPTQTQNLFAKFMHQGEISSTKIFVNGQAYGFAFDENAGPVPPAPNNQPNVPSKFDPVPDGTTTMTITLGPWKPSIAAEVGGELQVVGTDERDLIHLIPLRNGDVRVIMNGKNHGVFRPTVGIVVNGLAGNDIIISAGIRHSLAIDGSEGHDLIIGGRYADVIDGGPGHDILIGGPGQDELIGGDGRNLLIERSVLLRWFRFWACAWDN